MSWNMASKSVRPIVIAIAILLSAGAVLSAAGLVETGRGGDVLSLWGCAPSYPDIDALALTEYKPVSLAGIRENAYVSAGDRYAIDADVYYFDAEFFPIYPVDILWGMFPEEYPPKPQAMVNESLAFALYGHTHGIGRTFSYDGEDYEITAVCADADPGQSALYLWASGHIGAPVTYLGLSKEAESGGMRWILRDRFSGMMDGYALAYTVFDPTAARHRVYFLFFLFLFGIAVLFLILMIPRIKDFAVGKYRMLRDMRRDKYAVDMLPQVLLWTLAAVISVVVVLALCKTAMDILAAQLGYLDTPDDFYHMREVWEFFRGVFDPADKRGTYFPPYMAPIRRGETLLGIGCHLTAAGILLAIPVFVSGKKERGSVVDESDQAQEASNGLL